MSEILFVAILVGFIAQIIDGALGMAYGVTSNSFLLSLGIPPAPASASIHTAEIFTTLTSGISHIRLKNIDTTLFKKLLIPGIIGGLLGAISLVYLPVDIIKIVVSIYLLTMGLAILKKVLKTFKKDQTPQKTNIPLLGAIGGFLDALGGGGWGPVVTSTLVAKGNNPRITIGSVNLAEFFVTLSEAATFFAFLGLLHLEIITGLIIGGVIAAPLAAYTCRKLPTRLLMTIVGCTITTLSARTLYLALT